MRGVAKKKPECLVALRLKLEKTGTCTWNGRLAGEALTAEQTEPDERRTEHQQRGGFRYRGGLDGASQADPIPGTTGLGQVHNQHGVVVVEDPHAVADRKSTRLNSSHLGISYAVFCL